MASAECDDGSVWGSPFQQLHRVYPEGGSDALHRAQCEIALPTLDAAHVGSMDAQNLGQCLLAQPARFPVGTQILTEPSLKFPFRHSADSAAGAT